MHTGAFNVIFDFLVVSFTHILYNKGDFQELEL